MFYFILILTIFIVFIITVLKHWRGCNFTCFSCNL